MVFNRFNVTVRRLSVISAHLIETLNIPEGHEYWSFSPDMSGLTRANFRELEALDPELAARLTAMYADRDKLNIMGIVVQRTAIEIKLNMTPEEATSVAPQLLEKLGGLQPSQPSQHVPPVTQGVPFDMDWQQYSDADPMGL